MNGLLLTGRLLYRNIYNGFANLSTALEPNFQLKKETENRIHVLTAVCGFAKPKTLLSNVPKGQFGDDAWFIAKHVAADVLGVADGVGGWRHYGLNPGDFSLSLMQACERYVKNGHFTATDPAQLLAIGYKELQQVNKSVTGSSTACLAILNRENRTLYTANIGDSGLMVVRNGNVVCKSEEQQHYFNTPYQLSVPPPGHQANVLSDAPESANTDSIEVEDGDVIMLATDGVFDNVPFQVLLQQLTEVQGVRNEARLKKAAQQIAVLARDLSCNETFFSPFAENAAANGIHTIGGKPDDITVLLATVTL